MCQGCSDSRCHLCLSHCGKRAKLSIPEQIALFNSLNPHLVSDPAGCCHAAGKE